MIPVYFLLEEKNYDFWIETVLDAVVQLKLNGKKN